ncbi:hypothetical protein [Janthinobacterium fluminis]|uniref:Class IIb bacteriocin, lactobin A/cerein 7B family n=1 Tax=Janthinobacterium fluminis TaxID=2987524 RepID=A0ABT5K0H0_9BURK|nr:hypothetical protein [Janthinobacterium fluminis]MDC8758469.1 hypothetical protein [Janthinobacterium fluminis]
MYELTADEIDEVNGGVKAGMFLVGFAAAMAGAGLAVAGLGTPITIGGAVLAAQGAAVMSIALVS